MRRALIGHTGFVGGNLLVQTTFTHCYHSKNIESIASQEFDLAVCCAAPAEKWRVNREPQADWDNLERLMMCLKTMKAARLILISTVDVFPVPHGVDEDSPVHVTDAAPYGKHRYLLEEFARERFNTLVVRLPGLFGPGLKKNVIFDFLHGNQVDRVDSAAVYQFYDLKNLWSDLQRADRAGLRLVHLATEPVSVAEVATRVFGFAFENRITPNPPVYDFRTRHDRLYGGRDGYIHSRTDVLEALRRFVDDTRGQRLCA
jgi:nucleoside-diphosphate-sugar epimerase